MEELIEAFTPLLKISGGFAEVRYLLVLLLALVFLVLQLLFEGGVCGQRSAAAAHSSQRRGPSPPLKCGLELGSICMVEFCQLSID
jgi:hypothetical protein